MSGVLLYFGVKIEWGFLTRSYSYGLAPLQVPLLEKFIDCTLNAGTI